MRTPLNNISPDFLVALLLAKESKYKLLSSTIPTGKGEGGGAGKGGATPPPPSSSSPLPLSNPVGMLC